jgi:hypothetical protein
MDNATFAEFHQSALRKARFGRSGSQRSDWSTRTDRKKRALRCYYYLETQLRFPFEARCIEKTAKAATRERWNAAPTSLSPSRRPVSARKRLPCLLLKVSAGGARTPTNTATLGGFKPIEAPRHGLIRKSAARNHWLQSHWGTAVFEAQFLPPCCANNGNNCPSEMPLHVGFSEIGISAADRENMGTRRNFVAGASLTAVCGSLFSAPRAAGNRVKRCGNLPRPSRIAVALTSTRFGDFHAIVGKLSRQP